MKFNCYYRGKDGSRKVIVLDANNRDHAYQQAKDADLSIIEILQSNGGVGKNKQVRTTINKNMDKVPNEDELKLLQMRRCAYWIGFISAFFSPIMWIIACIIAFCKYEMRGLSCCITGIITPGVPVGIGILGLFFGGLVNPIFGFVLGLCSFVAGIWVARYFYKKDVLLGFIMPTNTNNL